MLTFNSLTFSVYSVHTLYAVNRNYHKWWMIEIDGEREPMEYFLSILLDNICTISIKIYSNAAVSFLDLYFVKITWKILHFYGIWNSCKVQGISLQQLFEED